MRALQISFTNFVTSFFAGSTTSIHSMPAPSSKSGSSSADDDQNESVYYDQATVLNLSPHLETQVSSILQAKDPLDAPQFDPTEYINRLFPNGSSSIYSNMICKIMK
jgi:hypothetical protein